MQHVLKNISSLLVISSLLLCAFASADGGENCAAGQSLAGRYLSNFWLLGVDVLGPPSIVVILELAQTGCNTFEGGYVGLPVFMSGFYSPETRIFSATWRNEVTRNWGAIQYYWNGRSLNGPSNGYQQQDGFFYEVLRRVNSTYQAPEPVTCP